MACWGREFVPDPDELRRLALLSDAFTAEMFFLEVRCLIPDT
jgi:hypothetical protein